MTDGTPFRIGGYVLAGGRSSRMGTDKALLQLGGRPLIERAVAKLAHVCDEVHILSSNPALASFAPLVADLHPDCGPIGGFEAALTHSSHDWNLFLAVDMPFLPASYISACIKRWSESLDEGARIRIFSTEGRSQPGFCLLHRDVLPYLSEAIEKRELKLMQAFEAAGRQLAVRHGFAAESGLSVLPVTDVSGIDGEDASGDLPFMTALQEAAVKHWWFANINTPEDLTDAEKHASALNT